MPHFSKASEVGLSGVGEACVLGLASAVVQRAAARLGARIVPAQVRVGCQGCMRLHMEHVNAPWELGGHDLGLRRAFSEIGVRPCGVDNGWH